jgi:hypothetical protein
VARSSRAVGNSGFELDGFLEGLDGIGVLGVFVRADAFVQIVARPELLAARGRRKESAASGQGQESFHHNGQSPTGPAPFWSHQAYLINAGTLGDVNGAGDVLKFEIRIAFNEDNALGTGGEHLFQAFLEILFENVFAVELDGLALWR